MTIATPPTLTEFLLARLAEDEAVAQSVRPHEYLSRRDSYSLHPNQSGAYMNVAATSGRVLAEVEAKRRIVDLAGPDDGVFDDDVEGGIRYDGTPVTRALAAIYSDHPDYRDDEWRP